MFLQYPFEALIRKHCEPHETASPERGEQHHWYHGCG